MASSHDGGGQDLYLILRRGIYHYKRRVPEMIAPLDLRSPHVRISLKTRDLAVARLKRDAYREADDRYWASLLKDGDEATAAAAYSAAVRRAEALGFEYRQAADLASRRDVAGIIERLEAVIDERTPRQTVQSVLGAVPAPAVTVKKAFDVYVNEIAAPELRTKSKTQRDTWLKVKRRAVNNFVMVVSDKALTDITREDALKFYRHWLARIVPEDGTAPLSVSSGNKDVGNMRVLVDEYLKHMGVVGYQNPFAGLTFTEKIARTRPPFPTEWIKDKFLQPGLLANMNSGGRRLLLAMVETGARPSELCNLPAEHIHLGGEVPYIEITPADGGDDPYEIKTASSIRKIPLVGVSLAVFKKQPKGFPEFYDRHNSVTTQINKFMRENKLRPTAKHSLYSLRHSFEDRMKNGKLDVELRKMLFGHKIDRQKYGEGGDMKMWQSELTRIALPYDPSIV